jgi:hypothetical protein
LKIKSLVWLDEVIEKLSQKHNVRPHEVKEILESGPHFRFVEKGTARVKMYIQPLAKLKVEDI